MNESMDELVLNDDSDIIQLHIGEIFLNIKVGEANVIIAQMKVCAHDVVYASIRLYY